MLEKFTPEQLVREWRLRRGLLPLRPDGAISQIDGFDPDPIISARLIDWYHSLLDSAPVSLLPVSDIASDLSPSVSDDGVVTVTLPQSCRRVISVRLDCWLTDAIPVSPQQNPALAALQRSGYVRGSIYAPVAIYQPHQLTLYSADSPSPTLTSLRCISLPDDGSIILNRSALNLLPDNILDF